MLASIAEREQTRTLLRAKIQQIPETTYNYAEKLSICLSMSKDVQAEYRAKLCLSFVEAPPFFEAKPQRSRKLAF